MQFITDRQIYEQVIQEAVPAAESFLLLATSDLKDLYVQSGRCLVPFLEVLSNLASKGVAIRLLHAKEPGPMFRKDFDRYPNLIGGLECGWAPSARSANARSTAPTIRNSWRDSGQGVKQNPVFASTARAHCNAHCNQKRNPLPTDTTQPSHIQ